MNNNSVADQIIEMTRCLSGSYGTSPFTVRELKIRSAFSREITGIPDNDPADQATFIAIMLWTDFDMSDMEDNIRLSKEFLELNEDQREKFLSYSLARLSNPLHLQRWISNQVAIATGIIAQISRSAGLCCVSFPEQIFPNVIRQISIRPNEQLTELFMLISDHQQTNYSDF